MFRGSLFLTLMLIISISLTGCSFSDIVKGFKNTFGSVLKGVGGVISSVAKVAKGVIEVVKPVVSAVSDAVAKLTGKENTFGDKINSALDKVSGIADKVDEFGQKVKTTGESMKSDEKDGDGTETGSSNVNNPGSDNPNETPTENASDTPRVNPEDPASGTPQVNPNDDPASGTPQVNPNDDPASGTPQVNSNENPNDPDDSLLTDEEKEAEKQKVSDEIVKSISGLENDIDAAIAFMKKEQSSLNNNIFLKNNVISITAKLNGCKKTLKECRENPLSQTSRAKYTLLESDLQAIKKQVDDMRARSEYCKEGLQGLMNSVEEAYKIAYEAFLGMNY